MFWKSTLIPTVLCSEGKCTLDRRKSIKNLRARQGLKILNYLTCN